MKCLYVYSSAQILGVCNPVAYVIDNVSARDESQELDKDIGLLMADLPAHFEDLQRTKEYQGFAKLFANMGYHGQTPAGKRLIDGFIKNGFKRINNIVDAYNIVSARYGCGLGLHDADKIFAKCHNIDIFRASGQDSIIPLFKDSAVLAKEGDLVYGSIFPKILVAWLGKRDVDSDEYKVTSETKSLLLVVTGNSQTSMEYNLSICEEVMTFVRKTCPEASANQLTQILQCN